MVEGHIGGNVVNVEPLSFCGVVAGFYFIEALCDYAPEDDGDLSASRVTADCAECVKLFERDTSQAGFLSKFSCDGVFEFFVDIDEAAGDGPFAFERVIFTPDKQKFRDAFGDGEDGGIDGDHRARPVINVFAFFVHIRILANVIILINCVKQRRHIK